MSRSIGLFPEKSEVKSIHGVLSTPCCCSNQKTESHICQEETWAAHNWIARIVWVCCFSLWYFWIWNRPEAQFCEDSQELAERINS